MNTVKEIKKAIGGALVTFGTGVSTAALDGGIDTSEWWGIAGGTLIAFGTVWALTNTEAE
jgi:hypothetical protein